MKLIDDWRKSWRFWSVRLGVLGTAITSTLVAFPTAALHAWALMPEELKAAVPPQYMPLIGVGVFALSIVSRLVRQDALHKEEQK